jgi:adenine-specific DNA glycosylase
VPRLPSTVPENASFLESGDQTSPPSEELGIEIDVAEQFATISHAYTHFRITLHAFHAHHVAGIPKALGCADWRWAPLEALRALPFPVTDLKILASLERQQRDE